MAVSPKLNTRFTFPRSSTRYLIRARSIPIKILRLAHFACSFTWSIPGIPALLLSAILLFSFYSYACLRFRRDPGSYFFNPRRAFDRQYSAFREEQALSWHNWAESMVDATGDTSRHDWERVHALAKVGDDPLMCASFISVYRDVPTQYLENSVSSALAKLAPPERADLDLRIYVAHANPSIHPAWSPSSWINYTVDEVFSSANATDDLEVAKALHVLEKWRNWSVKAVLDYTVALERCLKNSTAPYIAVFEGDTLLADSWFSRTLVGLQELEWQMQKMGRPGQWLYLRLFNQEKYTAWTNRSILANHVPGISFGISLAVFVALVKLKRLLRTTQNQFSTTALVRHVTYPTILVICMFTIPAFTILFFQAGKASMLPPLPGVHRQDFGCCSQALVFNRDHVAGLIDFLRGYGVRSDTNWGHDWATHEYAARGGLQRWSQYPVMAQHVGMTSPINTHRMLWEQPTWSMEFEGLSRRRLDYEHGKFVEQLYGREETRKHRAPVFGLKGLANS